VPRRAYIVAHGETAIDREGRIHGHLDPPLTDRGERTGRTVARQLRGKGIVKIFSSPRRRARRTAELIAKELNVPVEVRDELIPWMLGSMSGAKAKSIRPLIDFFSSRPDRAVPNGEPKQAMLDRYKKFMREVKRGKGPVAIAGHSQHTLALEHVIKGGDPGKVPMLGGTQGEIKAVSL
jgi:broad specificity phosphatase PhoE